MWILFFIPLLTKYVCSTRQPRYQTCRGGPYCTEFTFEVGQNRISQLQHDWCFGQAPPLLWGPSFALQHAWQRPWPLHTRCQQRPVRPPNLCQTKLFPEIATCPLEAPGGPPVVEKHCSTSGIRSHWWLVETSVRISGFSSEWLGEDVFPTRKP